MARTATAKEAGAARWLYVVELQLSTRQLAGHGEAMASTHTRRLVEDGFGAVEGNAGFDVGGLVGAIIQGGGAATAMGNLPGKYTAPGGDGSAFNPRSSGHHLLRCAREHGNCGGRGGRCDWGAMRHAAAERAGADQAPWVVLLALDAGGGVPEMHDRKISQVQVYDSYAYNQSEMADLSSRRFKKDGSVDVAALEEFETLNNALDHPYSQGAQCDAITQMVGYFANISCPF